MDTMKIPGPDHPISLKAAPGRMQARFKGHVIADSADVIELKEASYKSVCYFPRGDVDMAFMAKTDLVTHCPYKGDAGYFTLTMDGAIAENVVWTYEAPYPAMETLRGRLAFYPNQVEVYEVGGSHPDASPSDVVKHTDFGGGQSQSAHWPVNVSEPPPRG